VFWASEYDIRPVVKEFQPCEEISDLLQDHGDGWQHVTEKRLTNLIYKNNEVRASY
jgi:hypothetical protein